MKKSNAKATVPTKTRKTNINLAARNQIIDGLNDKAQADVQEQIEIIMAAMVRKRKAEAEIVKINKVRDIAIDDVKATGTA
jgi:hypothetical protein